MKTCPKCAYTRTKADTGTPDWQCPKCGIAYAKFEQQQVADWEAKRSMPPVSLASGGWSFPFKTVGWVLVVAAVGGYGAYDRLVAKPQADAAKIATAEESGPGVRVSAKVAAELAQITPSKVVMFATDWCGYCAAARKIFKEQGVRYTEIDIERDPEGAKFQADRLGASGVPTIVIGNRLIHGFDEGQILAGLKEL